MPLIMDTILIHIPKWRIGKIWLIIEIRDLGGNLIHDILEKNEIIKYKFFKLKVKFFTLPKIFVLSVSSNLSLSLATHLWRLSSCTTEFPKSLGEVSLGTVERFFLIFDFIPLFSTHKNQGGSNPIFFVTKQETGYFLAVVFRQFVTGFYGCFAPSLSPENPMIHCQLTDWLSIHVLKWVSYLSPSPRLRMTSNNFISFVFAGARTASETKTRKVSTKGITLILRSLSLSLPCQISWRSKSETVYPSECVYHLYEIAGYTVSDGYISDLLPNPGGPGEEHTQ